MNKKKTIYDLTLHEIISICADISVRRVPGGWLYLYYYNDDNNASNCVFVPYNDEFKESLTKNEIFKQRIFDTDLSVRAINSLRKMDIETVEEMANMSRKKFLRCHNNGPVALEEIENFLNEYNIQIKR